MYITQISSKSNFRLGIGSKRFLVQADFQPRHKKDDKRERFICEFTSIEISFNVMRSLWEYLRKNCIVVKISNYQGILSSSSIECADDLFRDAEARLTVQCCVLEKGYCGSITDIPEINFVNYPKINGDIICLTSVMKDPDEARNEKHTWKKTELLVGIDSNKTFLQFSLRAKVASKTDSTRLLGYDSDETPGCYTAGDTIMWIDKNKVKPKNNIFITKPWMTKDLEKSEFSSLNSLKYLADSQRPWFESFNANITDQSVDEIHNLVMQLGNLYSSTFRMNASLDIEIDQLLMAYYKGPYDVTELMKNLTPQCSMILLKCKLHGTFRNCSNLFEFRKTQDGYCCTFNYARESDDILELPDVIESIPVHHVDDLGIERGLTVVMDPLLDDYFYSILPIVLVFNPTDYPDMTSGGVTELLAMPLSETYVDVTTTAFVSTQIIRDFPREKRNCIFDDEETMYKEKKYTYTKWLTIFPHEDTGHIFRNEENALHCQICYPACNDLNYDVLSWKSYMTPGGYNTNLLWNYNVTDEGVLHVYFSKYGTIRLKQDVAFYWYELMSDIGGICGVFIGFSFISVVELLYFFALLFRDLLTKELTLQEDDNQEEENPSVQAQTIRAIYWKELLPRSWHSAKYGKGLTNRARY
ncbi:Sodium channel protein Nach [Temnothorax longispinosus]|uniref:Sodium channel protein Nach n=1 Tax=Temnothorax longispinosus TaxID=300112 RepID=A0A4S2K928_9HYME|nr:Sodium channel protein Nach [Temnothorax longispinosus]